MKNHNGFTIIEIIIAIAILAVISMGIMSAMENMSRSASTSEARQERTSLVYEVGNILNSTTLCTTALHGSPIADGTEVALDANIHAGGQYGALSLSTVHLSSVTPITPPNYSAIVSIEGSKIKSVYGSSNFKESAKLYFSVDASNKLDKCLIQEANTAADCTAMGGAWNGMTCDFCAALGGTTLPNGNCKMVGATSYAWEPSAWSACSSGTQTRTVSCVDTATSLVVSNSFCSAVAPATSQTCTSYDWQIGSWGTCTSGSQTRVIQCIDTATMNPVAATFCAPPPATTQSCTGYSWMIGSWGACSSGNQTRPVNCKDDSNGMIVASSNCAGPTPLGTQSCSAYPLPACGTTTAPNSFACDGSNPGQVSACCTGNWQYTYICQSNGFVRTIKINLHPSPSVYIQCSI